MGKTGGGRGTNQYRVRGRSADADRRSSQLGRFDSLPAAGLATTGDVDADLASVADQLPDGTAQAWRSLVAVVPASAYLAGGTALACHLHHRVSRDLDFFFVEPFDVEALHRAVGQVGAFAPTLLAPGTLNGILGSTRVQFLEASSQHHVVEPVEFAGLRIASVPDLLAMKLKVIGDRAELRDYFDVMVIDQRTSWSVEVGLTLFVQRYFPAAPDQAVEHIVRGLGFTDDVLDDPGLPVSRDEVVDFWARRVRSLRR